VDKSVGSTFGIYSTSRSAYHNHRLACFHDLVNENALAFGETDIILVTRGKFVSCVALLALDSGVKTHAENNNISIFSRSHSLRISVTGHCKTRYLLLVKMTALGIDDPAFKPVLNALQEGDVSVGSTVVIAFKNNSAVAVGTDNRNGIDLVFIKGKNAVVFEKNH